MKRRSVKGEKNFRKRYSSTYPLNGLIICDRRNSTYNRVTWRNKSRKFFAWRCRERLKSGSVQCKQSTTVRESVMLKLLSELFNSIVKTHPTESTVYLIKTKAILRVNLVDKEEFDVGDTTKTIRNMTIE